MEATRSMVFKESEEEFKITFKGQWNRSELDKLHRLAIRELKRYKLKLRKEDEQMRASLTKEETTNG